MNRRQITILILAAFLVCTAGIITLMTTGGRSLFEEKKTVLLLCRETGEIFEMNRNKYNKILEKKVSELSPLEMMNMQSVAIDIDGKKAYLAFKDPQTGEVKLASDF